MINNLKTQLSLQEVIISNVSIAMLVFVNIFIFPLDALNIERGAPLAISSFVLSFALFLIVFYHYVDLSHFPKTIFFIFLVFSGIVLHPLLISVMSNQFVEYAPSVLRLTSYFLVFISFYYLSLRGLITFKSLFKAMAFLVLVCLLFSIRQIINDDLIFMNGANRLSSIYGATPAGLALLMLFFSVFFLGVLLYEKKSINRLISLMFLMFSLFMLIGTHSRQGLITFLLIFAMMMLIRASYYWRLIAVISIVFIFFTMYWLVLNTDYFPRLQGMLLSPEFDSSTQTRIDILSVALSNLNGLEYIFGIGLGGFNRFYYSIVGELGVAAHNDFLLFYVEGGVISIFSFIIFILISSFYWMRSYRELGGRYMLPYTIFLSVYILSFLNNPFYYPQVQFLSAAVLAYYVAQVKLRRVSA